MPVTADQVVVELEARLDNYSARVKGAANDFDGSMSKMEKSAQRAEGQVRKAANDIADSTRKAGAAAQAVGTAGPALANVARVATLAAGAIGLSAASLLAGAKAAVEYAASLDEISQKTGLTVEQIQILERAGTKYGFTTEQATAATDALNKKLGEAQAGTPAAIKLFQSIGISQEQIASFHTVGQAIPAVMQAISEFGTQTERATAANRVFGDSADDLLPFLSAGADGYNEVAAAAQEAGVITADQARQAADAQQRLDDLATTLKTNLTSALVDIVPFIENVASLLGGLASKAATAAQALWDALPATAQLMLGAPFAETKPQNAGIIQAAREQGLMGWQQDKKLAPLGVPKPRAPRKGRTAKAKKAGPTPYEQRGEAYADMPADILNSTLPGLDAIIVRTEELSALVKTIDFSKVVTVEDQQRIEGFANDFRQDIAGGLADAVIYGRNLGDVLESSFKRAAATLLESGIVDILSGGKQGTSFGTLFGGLGAALGFASGGSFTVGGRGGVDRNTLSLNGLPVANVSRGETVSVSPQGRNPRGAGGNVSARGGAVNRIYSINVSADHSVTPAGFAKGLAQEILQRAAQMDAAMGQAVVKGVPARLNQYQDTGF